MSNDEQQDVIAVVDPVVEETARLIRQRATLALGMLATTTLSVHNEQMNDWLLEQPEMQQTYEPIADTCFVTYTIRRVLPDGVTKERKFNAIFERGELVNTSVDFCITDVPVQPTAIAS